MTSLHPDERSVLVTLRDTVANLQAHIDHRAQELAQPLIAKAREAALTDIERARREQQRAEDLVTELHRQYAVLERRRAEQQQRAERAEAALTAARENRGSEIHGEPRTDPTPTRDTRPAL